MLQRFFQCQYIMPAGIAYIQNAIYNAAHNRSFQRLKVSEPKQKDVIWRHCDIADKNPSDWLRQRCSSFIYVTLCHICWFVPHSPISATQATNKMHCYLEYNYFFSYMIYLNFIIVGNLLGLSKMAMPSGITSNDFFICKTWRASLYTVNVLFHNMPPYWSICTFIKNMNKNNFIPTSRPKKIHQC